MTKQITKTNFHDTQLLTAEELNKEQEYHASMRRLRNSAYHRCGIVKGLDVLLDKGVIKVTKGMALVQNNGGAEFANNGSIPYEEYIKGGDAVQAFDRLVSYEVYLKEDITLNIEEYFNGDGIGEVELILTISYNETQQTIEPLKGPQHLYIIEGPEFTFYDASNTEELPGLDYIELARIMYAENEITKINTDTRRYSGLFAKQAQFNTLRFRKSDDETVTNYSSYPFIEGREGTNDNNLNIKSNAIDMHGPVDENTTLSIEGDLTVNKNITVSGNALIKGNLKNLTSTLLGSELLIKDNIITLNKPVENEKPKDISGIEIYRGEDQDGKDLLKPSILWKENEVTKEIIWEVTAIKDNMKQEGKLAFGIEELRTGENSDHFHKHSVLTKPNDGSSVVFVEDDEEMVNKIGIGIDGETLKEKLTVNGPIKVTGGIRFPDSSLLESPIIPESELFTHVLTPVGDTEQDTKKFQSMIGSNRSVLITGSMTISRSITIANVENLKITGPSLSGIELVPQGSSVFRLQGICNNIEFNNLRVTSLDTTLVQTVSGSTMDTITVKSCSKSSYSIGERCPLFYAQSCDLTNIEIRQNLWETGATNEAIYIYESTIKNLNIINNTITYKGEEGEGLLPRAITISAGDGSEGFSLSNIQIRHNTIKDFRYPIQITNFNTGSGIDISNNTIYLRHNGATAIACTSAISTNKKLHLVTILQNRINTEEAADGAEAFSLQYVGSGNINDNELTMKEKDYAFNITDSENVNIVNNIIKKAQAGTTPDDFKINNNLFIT